MEGHTTRFNTIKTLFDLAFNNTLSDKFMRYQMMGYSDDLSAIVKGDLPAREILKNVNEILLEVRIGIKMNESVIMQIISSKKHKQHILDDLLRIQKV